MSDSQAKTDRGSTWEDEEVVELINIWADERIQQQLDGCTRKRPIFEKMAKTLAEAGFTRTFSQVREKIKQLKQNYKKIKDNNNKSGNNRKTCKYFEQLDSILGDRPITRPPSVIESTSNQGCQEYENSLSGAGVDSSEDEIDEFNPGFDFLSRPSPSSSTSNDTGSLSVDGQGTDENTEVVLPSKKASTMTPGTVKSKPEVKTPNDTSVRKEQEKILSSKRGKSRKRSRNEAFLSDVCSMIQSQQQAADERFFKMEEERQAKEIEREERRRKEEREHELFMMRMMGNMFMQVASSFNQGPPMQQQQNHFQSMPQQMYHQAQHSYMAANNSEQCDEDSIYTSL